jgi:RNA polymerase sigma-70 factor (ECF subfamily)
LRGDDLDELFQQVRIRLWRALGRDAIESVPASYVYRTAVTAALDLIRRRQARREISLDPVPDDAGTAGSDALDVPDPARRVDETLGAADLAARVSRALERVIDSRRPVVRMYLAGHSPNEISDLFGWTTMKTRNLLYRGLSDLRRELAKEGISGVEDAWMP